MKTRTIGLAIVPRLQIGRIAPAFAVAVERTDVASWLEVPSDAALRQTKATRSRRPS